MARIVILGGGFGGFYPARGLEPLAKGHALTLVSGENYFLFTPLLPEAASGSIEPRHVVVPLRPALRRTRVVVGRVDRIDTTARSVVVRRRAGAPIRVDYDQLVVALGSVPRFLDIPGLKEHARGFKTLAEGIWLRNHVLEQLELADAADDPAERAARLTFVIVGGGYAGIEAAAEMLDLCRAALRWYPRLAREPIRWVVVEAAGAILPEIGAELSAYALRRLRAKGMEVRLNTQLVEARESAVVLSDGETLPTRTLVWTAGVVAHPLVAALPAERDERGRLLTTPEMRVPGLRGVWALGDCAAVPDAKDEGRPAPPTAQHALRQARRLAGNIAAAARGRREAIRLRVDGDARRAGLVRRRGPPVRQGAHPRLLRLVGGAHLPPGAVADLRAQTPGGAGLDGGALLPARHRAARSPGARGAASARRRGACPGFPAPGRRRATPDGMRVRRARGFKAPPPAWVDMDRQ